VSVVAPLLRIPIGVVVERRKAKSAWADVIWRPVAILAGRPDAELWTPLATDGDSATYYGGPAEIELYRAETENYRRNLASGSPSLWVALQATGGEPPYEVAAVTADPAEGEGLTEPGQAIVEALPMPGPVQEAVADFVARYHVEQAFQKRKRDRADPEALARRGPRVGRSDER
jgi:hypothetical protein